jgi:hypothetical protein
VVEPICSSPGFAWLAKVFVFIRGVGTSKVKMKASLGFQGKRRFVGGFCITPRKGSIQDYAARVESVWIGDVRYDFFHIDGRWLLAELIASVKIDVLPCNGRDLFNEVGSIFVATVLRFVIICTT